MKEKEKLVLSRSKTCETIPFMREFQLQDERKRRKADNVREEEGERDYP